MLVYGWRCGRAAGLEEAGLGPTHRFGNEQQQGAAHGRARPDHPPLAWRAPRHLRFRASRWRLEPPHTGGLALLARVSGARHPSVPCRRLRLGLAHRWADICVQGGAARDEGQGATVEEVVRAPRRAVASGRARVCGTSGHRRACRARDGDEGAGGGELGSLDGERLRPHETLSRGEERGLAWSRGTAATSRMSRVAGVCACSSCRHACSRSRRTRLRVGARP
mmetsp:Transcript_96879/g.269640  ORF Transcript_96879/g.269640 Transcript_96879/m.269640 type:complete len:223 (+) Transcript_96879:306-974(+)